MPFSSTCRMLLLNQTSNVSPFQQLSCQRYTLSHGAMMPPHLSNMQGVSLKGSPSIPQNTEQLHRGDFSKDPEQFPLLNRLIVRFPSWVPVVV